MLIESKSELSVSLHSSPGSHTSSPGSRKGLTPQRTPTKGAWLMASAHTD